MAIEDLKKNIQEFKEELTKIKSMTGKTYINNSILYITKKILELTQNLEQEVTDELIENLETLDVIYEEAITIAKKNDEYGYCELLHNFMMQKLWTIKVMLKSINKDNLKNKITKNLASLEDIKKETELEINSLEQSIGEYNDYNTYYDTESLKVLRQDIKAYNSFIIELPKEYRKTSSSTIEGVTSIEDTIEIKQITSEVEEICMNFQNNSLKSKSGRIEEEISIRLEELSKIAKLKNRMFKLISKSSERDIKLSVLEQLKKIEKVTTEILEDIKSVNESLSDEALKLSVESSRIVNEIKQKQSAIKILSAVENKSNLDEARLAIKLKDLDRLEQDLLNIQAKLQEKLKKVKSIEDQKIISGILKNIEYFQTDLTDFKKNRLNSRTLESISLADLDDIDLESALRLFALNKDFDRYALEARCSELLEKYEPLDAQGIEEREKADEMTHKVIKLKARLLTNLRERHEESKILTLDDMTEEDLQKIQVNNDIKTALHLFGLKEGYTREELENKKYELYTKYRENPELTHDKKSSLIDKVLAINTILETELNRNKQKSRNSEIINNSSKDTTSSTREYIDNSNPVKVVATRAWNWVKDHKKQILIGIGILAISLSMVSMLNLSMASQMVASGAARLHAGSAVQLALHDANITISKQLLGLRASYEAGLGVWTIGGQKILTSNLINMLTGVTLVSQFAGLGVSFAGLISKKSNVYKDISEQIKDFRRIPLDESNGITRGRYLSLADTIKNSNDLSNSEKNELSNDLINAYKYLSSNQRQIFEEERIRR